MKKKLLVVLAVIVIPFGVLGTAEASWLTDPTPTMIASVSGDTVILTKDLSGFHNYGTLDAASDVLYSGEQGSWSFDLSSLFSTYNEAQVSLTLALDDHYSVPTAGYSMTIDLLANNSFAGLSDTLGLVHGSPYGQSFTNWTSTTFGPLGVANPFTVSIQNTSTIPTSHWIAIDKIELTLTKPVPEPATVLLMGTGLAGLAVVRRRMNA